jgi:hypothetical protein
MGQWMYRSTFFFFFTLALAGGEWSASRPCPFTPGDRAPVTYWIRGWVGPGGGLDDVEKRKFLTLSGLELWPLGRPSRSQSLYRLCYPGCSYTAFRSINILQMCSFRFIANKISSNKQSSENVLLCIFLFLVFWMTVSLIQEWKMWIMNWKGCERKWPLLNVRVLSGICSEGQRKTMKTLKSAYLVSLPNFVVRTFRIRVRSFTTWGNLLGIYSLYVKSSEEHLGTSDASWRNW